MESEEREKGGGGGAEKKESETERMGEGRDRGLKGWSTTPTPSLHCHICTYSWFTDFQIIIQYYCVSECILNYYLVLIA